MWNTYGPTEATVVACGALLDGTDPVRIGLPLDGWDLAVVDARRATRSREGESGELIIGGVGLARYLDPEKDAEKYAPDADASAGTAPTAPATSCATTRSGCVFAGRADDQIKLGGRRIELGEIDGQLLRLPGVVRAAAAVRSTKAGNKLLVGYLTVDEAYDAHQAHGAAPRHGCPRRSSRGLRWSTPSRRVPAARSTATRCRGRCPSAAKARSGSTGTQAWLAEIWADVLGADVTSPKDDFFDFGGGSLTAAQVVSRIRERFPEVAVGDVYAHPTIAAFADCPAPRWATRGQRRRPRGPPDPAQDARSASSLALVAAARARRRRAG